MAQEISAISRALSDVLTGAYARKRLTQEQIAKATDMPLVTVQKKLRGRSPISATDLVILSNAIGVSPAKMLEDAIAEVDEAKEQVSETPVSLDAHRQRKTPAEMTDEELEGLRSAANTDPDVNRDEPELP